MAVPSGSDFNKWSGTKFTNTDWDQNVDKTVEILANGNYDLNVAQVTATSYVGIPSDQFSTITAGENLTAGDIVRISSGQAFKADNSTSAGITAVVGVCNTTVSSGGTVKIDYGFYNSFSSLTAGTLYYVGTSGGITSTKPTNYPLEIGTAVSATRININIKEPDRFNIIDRRTYWSTGASFNSNSSWINVTPQRKLGGNPFLWATQKIIDGIYKVYLNIEINGGGSGGDGIDIRIIDNSGTAIFLNTGNVLGNIGSTAIYTLHFDLNTGNSTNLNIGNTPLLDLTTTSVLTSSRWTLMAKRSSGSSTSGSYTIRSIQFVLVEV
jgi:hypothetical protein